MFSPEVRKKEKGVVVLALLDGKVAIVTGAGRGVGRGHALLLAEEGAAVVVNDFGGNTDGEGRDKSPAQAVVDDITTAGGAAVANFDDVSSWDGAQSLVQQAIDDLGRLDILVNNAGILRDAMCFNMEEEAWDAVIRVHLKGHFAPSRFAAAHWRALAKSNGSARGRIINTTSESGLFGNAGQTNYDVAKAGIATMTLVMARELERYGVTVNAVAPRARTRMTKDLLAARDMAIEPSDGSFDWWDPANVAPTIVWLASDAAAHVSGQVFIVGGRRVTVVEGYQPVGEVVAEGKWTPQELAARHDELFGARGASIPRRPAVAYD